LVQSAASSQTCVIWLGQALLTDVHIPPSPPRQHTWDCVMVVSHVVLPHVTIIGSLGNPPSGTGTTVPAPLELAPPSPGAPPSPPELLAPCPLLAPSASASSPPPLELSVPPLL
jgi:hypothetical protein